MAFEHHDPPQSDPWEVLGVSADANAETLRQAYLKKIRQYPPDRAPQEFERIRDAYDEARKPAVRLRVILRADKPHESLASLLDGMRAERAFTGPKPWLAAIREK